MAKTREQIIREFRERSRMSEETYFRTVAPARRRHLEMIAKANKEFKIVLGAAAETSSKESSASRKTFNEELDALKEKADA